ncbi:MAG: hypothetical protein AB7U18_08395, partial [Dehalococcoidia bacterium]
AGRVRLPDVWGGGRDVLRGQQLQSRILLSEQPLSAVWGAGRTLLPEQPLCRRKRLRGRDVRRLRAGR